MASLRCELGLDGNEISRQGRYEGKLLAVAGMNELELSRMQERTIRSNRMTAPSIRCIADDRMADRRKMHPDLVGTS